MGTCLPPASRENLLKEKAVEDLDLSKLSPAELHALLKQIGEDEPLPDDTGVRGEIQEIVNEAVSKILALMGKRGVSAFHVRFEHGEPNWMVRTMEPWTIRPLGQKAEKKIFDDEHPDGCEICETHRGERLRHVEGSHRCSNCSRTFVHEGKTCEQLACKTRRPICDRCDAVRERVSPPAQIVPVPGDTIEKLTSPDATTTTRFFHPRDTDALKK